METTERQALHGLIKPILTETYGENVMACALADELAWRMEGYHGSDREDLLMRFCWNWFPGGTTAANTARRINGALAEHYAVESEYAELRADTEASAESDEFVRRHG